MSEKDKVIDTFDTLPVLKGYPRPDEPEPEDEPAAEEDENRQMEGRTPDLGELDEDPSEI